MWVHKKSQDPWITSMQQSFRNRVWYHLVMQVAVGGVHLVDARSRVSQLRRGGSLSISGGQVVLFKGQVLCDLGLGSFFEGVSTVVKGTSYVNYQNTVVFFDYNVRMQVKAGSLDGAVGSNVTKVDGVGAASRQQQRW